jgi:hypothetical protein
MSDRAEVRLHFLSSQHQTNFPRSAEPHLLNSPTWLRFSTDSQGLLRDLMGTGIRKRGSVRWKPTGQCLVKSHQFMWWNSTTLSELSTALCGKLFRTFRPLRYNRPSMVKTCVVFFQTSRGVVSARVIADISQRPFRNGTFAGGAHAWTYWRNMSESERIAAALEAAKWSCPWCKATNVLNEKCDGCGMPRPDLVPPPPEAA